MLFFTPESFSPAAHAYAFIDVDFSKKMLPAASPPFR